MKNITLEQILMLYYFRRATKNTANNGEYDNDVVRIYYDDFARYFEFGIEDLGEEDDKKKQLHMLLPKELLDREVDYIDINDVIGMLLIYLK